MNLLRSTSTLLLLGNLLFGCSPSESRSTDGGSLADGSSDASIATDMRDAIDSGADMTTADADVLDASPDAAIGASLADIEAAYWEKLTECTHIENSFESAEEFWWWGSFFTRLGSDQSAAACVSHINAASCDLLWPQWVPFRRRGWPSDAIPSDAFFFQFFVGEEWPLLDGPCVEALRIGVTGDSCEFEAECSPLHKCRRSSEGTFPGTCEARLGEGEDCSDAGCLSGLVCTSDVCVAAPTMGEACVWTCAEGLECTTRERMGPGGPIYGTCVTPREVPELPEEGDACGQPLSCGDVFTGLYCDYVDELCRMESE